MIAKQHRLKYIDVNALITRRKLSGGYDKKRKCYVVDTEKLNAALIKVIKRLKKVVIDSHLSHYLPAEHADLCIITKCSLKELKRRLESRGYDRAKVKENLESEIFDICRNEAIEIGHRVRIVRTTKGVNRQTINRILKKNTAI
jgi:adenylate kinase